MSEDMAKQLIDDLWIEIFVYCNVTDFLSVNETCRQFHDLTRSSFDRDTTVNYASNVNYKNRLNQYWKNQCHALCGSVKQGNVNQNCVELRNNIYMTDDYEWYCIYQELFTIISRFYQTIDGPQPQPTSQRTSQRTPQKRTHDYFQLDDSHSISLIIEETLKPLLTLKTIGDFRKKLTIPIVQIIMLDCSNLFIKFIENQHLNDKKLCNIVGKQTISQIVNCKFGSIYRAGRTFTYLNHDMTLFHCACFYHSKKIINKLVKISPQIINTHNNITLTPLTHMIVDKNETMIKYLVSKGAQINGIVDSMGNTQLMVCAKLGRMVAMYRLIDYGFRDIYAKNCHGDTVLSIIATGEHYWTRTISFCEYVLKHNHQFGGEDKICQYIADCQIALNSVILHLDSNHQIRKKYIEFATKHGIKVNHAVGKVKLIRGGQGRTKKKMKIKLSRV